MTAVSLRFSNSNDRPLNIQVDPWAGLYRLAKGQEIELIAESETDSPEFTLDQFGDSLIVTIACSDEYFVSKDGKRLHWTDYPNNFG